MNLHNKLMLIRHRFVSIITASQLINFAAMCFTYIRWYNALKAQGIDRRTLPYRGWFQPYAAYMAMCGCITLTFVGGYQVFLNDQWDAPSFIFSYFSVALFPILFGAWKLIKKTKWKKYHEIDLKGEVVSSVTALWVDVYAC